MKAKALQTWYRSTLFRSRIEARYAVFMDVLGIRWVYENQGYKLPNGECYLPDFWLPDLKCFAEVKPEIFSMEEFEKSSLLPHICVLFDGQPRADWYCVTPHAEAIANVYDHNPRLAYFSYIAGYQGNAGLYWMLPEFSAKKERLWFGFGESIDAYDLDRTADAVCASRSARFERGERLLVRI